MTDETLDELRPRLIAAMVPHVAFDGWTTAALLAGAADAGIDPDVARVAFRGGAVEMAQAYTALADTRMVAALGNLSGFVFNYLIGYIQAETGSFPLALMPIAAVAAIGTVCVVVIGRDQPPPVAVSAT